MAYTGNLYFTAPAGSQGNRTWKYENTADTLADIKASGYFNSVTTTLRQYDGVEVLGSDGKEWIYISSASGAATVTSAQFSAGAATVADGSITTAKLAADAVTGDKLADNAVDSEHLTTGSIDAAHYAAGSVNAAALGTDAVTAVKIQNGAVTESKLGSGAVSADKLAAGSVTTAKLGAGAVDSNALASNAVVNSKVAAAAAIDFSKLAALTDGNLLVGSGSNVPTSVALSGDATLDNTGALTIANDAVTNAKLADDAVTPDKLANNAVTLAKMANGSVGGNEIVIYSNGGLLYGIPVVLQFDTAGGATANTDKVLTSKITITSIDVVNLANGTPGDTVQVQTSAGAAISDVIAVGGVSGTRAVNGSLTTANATIAPGGTLRIREVDGGGSDSPALRVTVYGFKPA
jgi:hypothetical protein